MSKLGDRAIVCGAAMGGLLAARVLSEFYETVTNEISCRTTLARGGGFGRDGILTCFGVAACKSWLGYFPVYSTNSSPSARRSAMTATSPGCPSGWAGTSTTGHANLPTAHRW
jgi:hypothetical protein